jgi:membrane protein
VMSLFPALLIGVAVLGYFGQAALVSDAADYLKVAGAPTETVDAVSKALESAQQQRGTALGALIIGLATALWGAAGAFGSVGAALNQVFRVEEGRGFVKHKLQNLIWTLLLIFLAAVTCMLLFLGGGLAEDVLGLIGLGGSAVEVWNVLRWPGALLVAMLVYAVVYYAAPNVEIRHWRYITPGAVFGVVLWILASAAFFFYVSSFASYSATYGAFATVVILLIWLYLTSAVLLLGAELNAVVDLRRSPDLPRNYDGPVLPPKAPAEA